MGNYKILSFVFLGLLGQTYRSQAIFQLLFPQFFDNVFGPRISHNPVHEIPKLAPQPHTLSAQASTLAQSEERVHQKNGQVITSTLMPHSVVHVPVVQKMESDLAQEIHAVDLPKTIEEALKKKSNTDGPIFVNINLNGQTVTKSSAVANSSQMGDTVEWLKKLKEHTTESYKGMVDWIRNNKKRFVLYCIGGSYCLLQTYLWYLAYSLQKNTCWSQWKNHCSLEELYRHKQSDLLQSVLEAVPKNLIQSPADDAMALTNFIKEAESELSMLNRYRLIVDGLDRICLGKIFFYNVTLHKEISNRINRLLFIKNSILGALNDAKK